MKLVCLNLWGARQGKLLFDYLKKQAETADIFCFQEVFDSTSDVKVFDRAHPHLLNKLQDLLPGFKSSFHPAYQGWIDRKRVDFQVTEGQAMFIRQGIQIKRVDAVFIYGDVNTQIKEDFTNEPKNLQFAQLKIGNKNLLIANVHGKWYPGDKLDTRERLKQSRRILEFLKIYGCSKILCGDFNLMPETESLKMLEGDLRNLIKDYEIKSTRNRISWQIYHNVQYFADYAFVSPDMKVNNFEAPYNEISDHLPLILDFNL